MQDNMSEGLKLDEVVSEFSDETGIIGEETKVLGNIKTKGHVEVFGFVKGNIEAKGDVFVVGKVEGNIQCNKLHIGITSQNSNAAIGGILKGNAVCKDIVVAGTVAGDIIAHGKVGLTKKASVRGNLKAATMCMEIGAKLEGYAEIFG